MSSSQSILLRVLLCLEILLLVTAYGGERKRYCGSELTLTMQFICRNKYASLRYSHDKRSGDSGDDAFINSESLQVNSPFQLQSIPFLPSFGSATALQPHIDRDYWKSSKRGLYDDCCAKLCSIQELLNYCA